MEPCVIFLVVAKQHEYLILGTGIICSYSAHKRKMCFGLHVAEGMDVDDLNSAANSFGDFSSLQPTTTALAAPVLVGRGSRFRTTASSGLRLREGPGIQFSVIRLLPPDTVVAILGTQDSWSIVDIDGDGLAEGPVASAFLGAL